MSDELLKKQGAFAAESVAKVNALTFVGGPVSMGLIAFVNVILTTITFGIYGFWARVRMRKYIWKNFSLDGDPFEYTGNGLELFLGFLKLLFFIILPFYILIIFLIVALFRSFAVDTAFILFYVFAIIFQLLFVYLVFAASYMSFRFLASRTTWRGVRFALDGSPWAYASEAYWALWASILTVSILQPRFETITYGKLVNNLRYGSARFSFDGNWQHLLSLHFITMILTPFTFGLSRLWYMSKVLAYTYGRTTIHGLALQTTYTPWKLFALYGGNFILALMAVAPYFLIIISFMPDVETFNQDRSVLFDFMGLIILSLMWMGFAYIFMQYRALRYFAQNVALLGDISTSGIMQIAQEGGAVGDELAGVLEIDGASVGVGL